ncbi:hypothetical protein OBV_28760 [Oscillibacter valericigenes Sjm18-20]|nr:hypothetical protein OBV_28760 [Oscillibacter valericigenes Sjm18-20]
MVKAHFHDTLTRAERRQIEAAVARTKRTDKKEKSAQDSIPFQRMFPDGICRVTDSYYTKTIQLQNINYQLNQNEDKTAIFDSWCDFLNCLDSSIRFQLSYVTHSGEGEGLLFYGNVILPFVDHFPKDTELYRIMTTKPQEIHDQMMKV